MDSYSWLNGARVAVLVSVLLESWADGKHPSYFPRTTALKPGAVDHAAIQWSEFGGKEGIWRIVGVIDQCKIPATVFCNALSAERYPDAIAQIVRSEHDIAAHGYSQDQYLMDMSPEQQRATIRGCLDILEQSTGRRPEGWVTPVYGGDQYTRDLLVQEGLKWHCDALDSSLPRRERTSSGEIVAIPWCDFVDNRVLRASPRDYYNAYKDTFDYLYAREPPGLVHLAIHCHFGGRPLMAAMLHEILGYFSQFSDVWFARHGELASWTNEQDPLSRVPAD